MDENASLTGQCFQDTAGTQDWRVVGSDALTWFATPSHAAGAALLRAVAGERCPDVDIRACGVRVRLRRQGDRFSRADIELARLVSDSAAELDLHPDPSLLQLVQLGIDSEDASELAPFWEQVLGHDPAGEALRDPDRRLPSVWFQEQDESRPLRNRLHLDVVTPQPVASRSRQAVLELGGQLRLEHDYYATIADRDGNEVDVLPLQEGADRWEGPATEDWRLVFSAMACYPVPDLSTALELVEQVAAAADDAGIDLGIDRRPGLVVLDSGKDRWEMTDGFQDLAIRVQQIARGLGLRADLDRPRFVQAVIDAVDIAGVRAFWAAALGYVQDERGDVTDLVHPHQLTMPIVLQALAEDEHERRAQRNRVHVDVFVPSDLARARVDAAVAAGGRVVYDEEAPLWWTVADPEGNEVCIAVSPGREEAWGD